MRNFALESASAPERAIAVHGPRDEASYIAGGTTLIDLIKLDVLRPQRVVDISRLALDAVERLDDGRLRIGALVTNSDLAHHPLVREHYPLLSQAILAGASTQIRNLATTGGNVMQRTRCPYYRDAAAACNRREPGSGCDALHGVNRMHAVLGVSEACIATHPSDMCVALAALGASLTLQGPNGSREIAFNDFHRLPAEHPEIEHELADGELITHVTLDTPVVGGGAAYLKLRDRASYEFALASAGAVVAVEDGVIRDVRLALGGVATKPWRAVEAEQALDGQPATLSSYELAAEAALQDAVPREHNAFKIPLARQAIVRALRGGERGATGSSRMTTQFIGQRTPRVDGEFKLTGRADYTGDHALPDMLFGYPVPASIAHGTLVSLETDRALAMPGVVTIFHHGNFPRLHRSPNSMTHQDLVGEVRLPFEDERIHYDGQYLALVVAETFEEARAAAHAVKARYRREDGALTSLLHTRAEGRPLESEGSRRGDPDAAFEQAAVRIDRRYSIAAESHVPMEMHATLAQWRDGRLIVHESSQGVVYQHKAMARIFDLADEDVEVVSHYIGSGFGNKLFMWPHAVATAAAAREVGRPVKTVLSRQQDMTSGGHRPASRQRLRLAADERGRLVSMRHDCTTETSLVHTYVDSLTSATPSLYACDNVATSQRLLAVNHGTPCPMRGPGEVSGIFALECALDELAEELGIDPLELRQRNYADNDPASGLPWSSKHLDTCYTSAAARFGWAERDPRIGAMTQGDDILGWGMATSTWFAGRQPCAARVELRAAGSILAACGTQDIGTGTYTVVAQTVAELTGVALADIEVRLGESSLPAGPLSGGSMATASTLPAVAAAVRQALDALKEAATGEGGTFEGASGDALRIEEGALVDGEGRRAAFGDILAGLKLGSVNGDGQAAPGDEQQQYSFRSFGAHFVEVRWDPGISRLRVARVVSSYDIGRAVNPSAARNQVEGSIVMGLGMGLLERLDYDPRDGRLINNNYADYIVTSHADMPDIDVELLDNPDYAFNEFGARGVGEIGLTGIAAAIANAVHHATGKRVRDLPISIEQLLVD